MGIYEQMFRRRSFHKFPETGKISEKEKEELLSFMGKLTPLEEGIRTELRLLKEEETGSKCGAEYCILFYSEPKGEYLRNIGYLGEQIDLYLASKNIGALWWGLGKTEEKDFQGLSFVIMMAIGKVAEKEFRTARSKVKRKPSDKIWDGERSGIEEEVRLAPSALNSQPWFVKKRGNVLSVFRKMGMWWPIPVTKMKYYNSIDMGIFLYFLEVSLKQKGKEFDRKLFSDEEYGRGQSVKIAEYELIG